MKKKTLLILFLLSGSFCFAQTEKSLPIIDTHLHALSGDDQGPPPYKMGIPFDNFGYWDPKDDYVSAFWKAIKSGCRDKRFATAPLTDDSVRIQTVNVLRENNIYAVTLLNTEYKTETNEK